MRISNVGVLLLSAPIPPERRWTSDFGNSTKQDVAAPVAICGGRAARSLRCHPDSRVGSARQKRASVGTANTHKAFALGGLAVSAGHHQHHRLRRRIPDVTWHRGGRSSAATRNRRVLPGSGDALVDKDDDAVADDLRFPQPQVASLWLLLENLVASP